METKFEITNQNINTQFEFDAEKVIIQGNFVKTDKDGNLKSVQGNVFAKNEDGTIGVGIGNFNGYVRGGQMKYTLSEMSCENAVLILQTIALLEPYITGENAENVENENAE
jgi:hypothetical protein